MFGTFLPLLGSRSRHCYAITCSEPCQTVDCSRALVQRQELIASLRREAQPCSLFLVTLQLLQPFATRCANTGGMMRRMTTTNSTITLILLLDCVAATFG